MSYFSLSNIIGTSRSDDNMKTEAVYKITNLENGKVYVGYSIDVERRFKQHTSSTLDLPLHKDMREIGERNFEFEIIEEVSDKWTGYQREAYWIGKLDTLIPNGYNTLPPGITLGEFLRIPILQIDIKTLEVLDRFESMSEVEQKLDIKQSNLSRLCNDENNGSISAGGYYWVKESEYFEGWKPHNQWEILQIEPETLEVVGSYKSISEAEKELGISGLYSAAAGENIMSNGFHWVYAKDYNKN